MRHTIVQKTQNSCHLLHIFMLQFRHADDPKRAQTQEERSKKDVFFPLIFFSYFGGYVTSVFFFEDIFGLFGEFFGVNTKRRHIFANFFFCVFFKTKTTISHLH